MPQPGRGHNSCPDREMGTAAIEFKTRPTTDRVFSQVRLGRCAILGSDIGFVIVAKEGQVDDTRDRI